MAKRKFDLDKLDSISTSAFMKENDFVSHAIQSEMNKLIEIDVEKIEENPHQPRLEINSSELEELANSIKENGLIQPISVNKIGNDNYEVVAGHRRLAACKLLKNKTIKAIVLSEMTKNDAGYDLKMASLALVENLQRKDLNVIETAISISNLLNLGIYKSQVDLAKSIGKQRIYVTKCLSILKLHPTIVADLSQNKSIKDLDALYFLQKISNPESQVEKYFDLVNKRITRNDLILMTKTPKESKIKQLFTINNQKGRLLVDANCHRLPADIQEKIENEIKLVLTKYLQVE
jgi:ParB family transcriptional regulator, chromosome partitioning protein